MFEDRNCNFCQLADTAKHPCLQGSGNPDSAKLVIYMDQPAYMDDLRGRPLVSEGADLLRHLFERMSIDIDSDVYVDYVLKCYAGKKLPSKKPQRLECYEACSHYRFATLQNLPNKGAVVAMGSLALEAFIGSKELKSYEGECWTPHEIAVRELGVRQIWVTYSPFYLLEKPAETPNIYRVLWTAAVEAGLSPQTNLKAKPFSWPI